MQEQRVEEQGKKFDGGKLRFDLIPVDVMKEVARVFTDGAVRYGSRNWEAGMSWSRPYAATQRHLHDFWDGVDVDADSGQSPLAHVIVEAMFLLAYQLRNTGTDDRPKGVKNGKE
jgi:hypothetical protein